MKLFKYIWTWLLSFDARFCRRFERTALRTFIELLKSAETEIDHKIKVLSAYCELKKQATAELKVLVDFYHVHAQLEAAKPPGRKRKPKASLRDVIASVYGIEALSLPAPTNVAPAPPPEPLSLPPPDTVAVS